MTDDFKNYEYATIVTMAEAEKRRRFLEHIGPDLRAIVEESEKQIDAFLSHVTRMFQATDPREINESVRFVSSHAGDCAHRNAIVKRLRLEYERTYFESFTTIKVRQVE